MASFFVTGFDQTSEVLATGETGIVTDTGTLFTNGVAISGDGQFELIVLGDVVAANSSAITSFVANDANITVGQDGSVMSSDGSGISANYRNSLSIQNAGSVSGDENGIVLTMASDATAGTILITNSGTISAAGTSGSGGGSINHLGQADTANRFLLNNSGIITHGSNASILAIDTAADIRNTGQLFGTVDVTGTQADVLWNGGQIVGDVLFGENVDRLTNHGTISGSVIMGQTGVFEGFTDAADTVVNTGLIDGDVFLSAGNDVFRNQGGTVLGRVFGGFGADTFHVDRSDIDIRDSNDGTISAGDHVFSTASFTLRTGIENLTLVGPAGLAGRGNAGINELNSGEGNDTLHGEDSGDFINGNAGNDALYGGRGRDLISGGDGDDILDGGRDSDTLNAGDGVDTMLGGSGDDFFIVGLQGGVIDGGTGVDLVSFLGTDGQVSINLATGSAVAADGTTWTLAAVEDVTASFGNDTVTGSGGANRIEAFDGNNSLSGGGGDDTLAGDGGADTMTGGGGADRFEFRSVIDSLTGLADLITDFNRNADIIDLSGLDADIVAGGDQAFAYIGTAAFGAGGGEVRFTRDTVAGLTTVEVRFAGSAGADMTIVLDGTPNLTVANFDL